METKITVLKFGSSVLRSEKDLPRVVHEIYRHWRSGSQVLAVVSAMGATTDQLLKRAENVSSSPHPSSLAALLATGEATAAALLGLAVHRAGIPVKVFSPAQVGLKTAGAMLKAEPVAADVERLRQELQNSIVIVSGFVGVSEAGDLTVLGRGGSDLTALFLSEKLGGRCVLIKDVAGLYQSNPTKTSVSRPHRFARANWVTTNKIGGGVVQPKALRFAEKHKLSFSIAELGANCETEIYGGENELALREAENAAPLRVALLGCGTVGGGVYQRLAELPEFFTITGVAVSRREKNRTPEIPAHLITTDAAELIKKPCDIVIELIGGAETANALITRALQLGRHVVTANKALLAGEIDCLEQLASRSRAKILYSAAVGGAMPALETVSLNQFSNNLQAFSGIINGTCNFICIELAKGKDYAKALRVAQQAGFAEADPALDVSGTDAAQKLILLARAAFGATLSLGEIQREGVENLDAAQVRQAAKRGRVVRLVAGCRRTETGVEAFVKPLELSVLHPFAGVKGVENCLQLETTAGETTFIKGSGAGRWATTEAVIADLQDLRREFTPVDKKRAARAGQFSFAEINV